VIIKWATISLRQWLILSLIGICAIESHDEAYNFLGASKLITQNYPVRVESPVF
jgi:hypothetical protein